MLIKKMKLNFNKETIKYSSILPPHIKANEVHVLVFLETGGGNRDEVFKVGIKDSEGQCRRWIMGHGYGQDAWSYNSETMIFPVNKDRMLEVTLDKPQPGHNGISFYVVAYQ